MIKIGTCKVQKSGKNQRIELIAPMRTRFADMGINDYEFVNVYVQDGVDGVILKPEQRDRVAEIRAMLDKEDTLHVQSGGCGLSTSGGIFNEAFPL